jgi:hypothetical protein
MVSNTMVQSTSFLEQAMCVRDRLPHLRDAYRLEEDEPENEEFCQYRRFSQLAGETRNRLPHYVPSFVLENDEALMPGYIMTSPGEDWRRKFQLTNEAFTRVAAEVRAQTPHMVPEYYTEHDGDIGDHFQLAKSPKSQKKSISSPVIQCSFPGGEPCPELSPLTGPLVVLPLLSDDDDDMKEPDEEFGEHPPAKETFRTTLGFPFFPCDQHEEP